MELTRGKKRAALAGLAVVAGCAAAIPFLPRLETIAAPYRGVVRVALPNYTRVDLPGSENPQDSAVDATGEAALIDETVAVSLEDPVLQAEPRPEARPGTGTRSGTRPAPGNVIPVKFDLQSPGLGDEVVGGDEIVVRKALRLGSREIGSLPIHVDSQSRLLVRPDDLKAVLESAGQASRLRSGANANQLRTFADLRKDGIDLRYDPNSDSVMLTIG